MDRVKCALFLISFHSRSCFPDLSEESDSSRTFCIPSTSNDVGSRECFFAFVWETRKQQTNKKSLLTKSFAFRFSRLFDHPFLVSFFFSFLGLVTPFSLGERGEITPELLLGFREDSSCEFMSRISYNWTRVMRTRDAEMSKYVSRAAATVYRHNEGKKIFFFLPHLVQLRVLPLVERRADGPVAVRAQRCRAPKHQMRRGTKLQQKLLFVQLRNCRHFGTDGQQHFRNSLSSVASR